MPLSLSPVKAYTTFSILNFSSHDAPQGAIYLQSAGPRHSLDLLAASDDVGIAAAPLMRA
jgi:hypothetical protein